MTPPPPIGPLFHLVVSSASLQVRIHTFCLGRAGGAEADDGDEPVPGPGPQDRLQPWQGQEDRLLLLRTRCLHNVSLFPSLVPESAQCKCIALLSPRVCTM